MPPPPPRLTDADKADLAARHEVVTARVMASEDIARKVLREPVDDATRHLVFSLAGESEASSVKRAMFSGVRAISDALSSAAEHAVDLARSHARNLATGQAVSDLGTFAARARELGFKVMTPSVHGLPGSTRPQDGAVAQQAGFSIAHRWSSQMLGNYTQWKREGGGVDQLVRRVQAAGAGGLDNLLETQAITQSVDAYADEHALTWAAIAAQVAGTATGPESDGDDGSAGWGAGLYDVWSAILDRGTCAECYDLDGTMVRTGTEFPGVGRAPLHVRCRCVSCAIWIPEAALHKVAGMQGDYELLKGDVSAYMKGASLNLGEGKRHAREFVNEALAGHSATVLAGITAHRRAYFPNLQVQRAPRLMR